VVYARRPMPALLVSLLGGFDATVPAKGSLHFPTRKAQALLAYLALRPAQSHPRAKLATLFWGEVPDAQARASLRQTLSLLGKTLGPAAGCLVTDAGTVRLAPGSVEVDAVQMERAAAAGTPDRLEAAAALYRGDLLEGLTLDEPGFEDWLLGERERLRELAIDVLAKLVAHHEAPGGVVERAIQAAVRLLALEPCQEAVHRALMRLYVRQGRQAAALRQYQVCVAALRRELNVDPEPETQRLYRELLERPPATPPSATAERVAPGETALVGRADELAQLVAAAADAADGRARVAVVLGEAGIGKTRLAEEIAIHALSRGARVMTGHCYETEQILPFAPWVDALRAGGVAGDAAAIARLGPAIIGPLGRLLPELASGGGATGEAENPLRLFESLAALLGALAVTAPLVVVLDDVHWADDMSLRLLAFLARRLGEQRVLVLATARAEALPDAPALRRTLDELGAARAVRRVQLGPLSGPATAELVRSLARTGTASARVGALAAEVWRVSEGNPFVAVETVRALQDAAAPGEGGVIPGSVREMIQQRLDRLGAPARQVLAVAAVAGGIVDVRIVQRAAGLEWSETAEGLEELVRCRVLHGVGEGFDFVHDRVRQVAETTLLGPRRTALHASIGAALEALHEDAPHEVLARLAHHFGHSADAERAVRYLARFATSAVTTGGHAEAIVALDRALGHLEGFPAAARERVRLDLVFAKARSFIYSGRFQAVIDVLGKEEETVVAQGDRRRVAHYHFLLAAAYTYTGRHTPSVHHARRSLEEATAVQELPTMGRARYVLALESVFIDPAGGVDHAREAVRILEQTEDREWLGQAHWILGVNYAYLGRAAPAMEALTRAREVAERHGDRRVQAFVAGTTGFVHALQGHTERALAAGRQAMALAVDPLYAMTSRAQLAAHHLEAGDGASARALLDEALPEARRFRHVRVEALIHALMAQAAVLEGRLDDVDRLAAEGIRLARTVDYRYAEGSAARAAARAARARGDRAGALAQLRAAAAAFAGMGAAYEESRTTLEIAELLLPEDRAGAVAAVAHARRLADDLASPALVARADRVPAG